MKQLLYISILLLLGVSGCQRRPLLDEAGSIAMVPLHIDWSQSSLKIEDISRVTVRVFPHDGSPAYNFVMQESKTDDVIPLAIGKYSFVIFNETTDPDDWNSLVFQSTDKYETFVVTTAQDPFKGLFAKTKGDIIGKSPEALAVFSIDEFEVTAQMANYTRALSRGGHSKAQLRGESVTKIESEMTRLTQVAPVSVVKHISIMVRVVNLVSAKKSSGTITDVVRSVQMSTRRSTQTTTNHVFILNGRQYDNPDAPKDGTIGASVAIFDPSTVENLKADLRLDFLLHDGSTPPTESFDITGDLKTDKNEISIALGGLVVGRPGDREIILPQVKVTSGNIGVDDWSEIVVPLK